MEYIAVSGDFRETYNLIACISGNPLKEKPVVYTIGKENGTATAFVAFCEMMVMSGWLRHDEIIVMDNAAIHTGGAAADLERFFLGNCYRRPTSTHSCSLPSDSVTGIEPHRVSVPHFCA
jgi:hypothetical protein